MNDFGELNVKLINRRNTTGTQNCYTKSEIENVLCFIIRGANVLTKQ